jgi:hypothetical protein
MKESVKKNAGLVCKHWVEDIIRAGDKEAFEYCLKQKVKYNSNYFNSFNCPAEWYDILTKYENLIYDFKIQPNTTREDFKKVFKFLRTVTLKTEEEIKLVESLDEDLKELHFKYVGDLAKINLNKFKFKIHPLKYMIRCESKEDVDRLHENIKYFTENCIIHDCCCYSSQKEIIDYAEQKEI